MEPVKKIKLMLTVEYAIFVAIFLTLGLLFLLDVIKVAEWKRYAFTYVTLAGGLWIIVDFFWTTFSPKRRAKNALIDKILVFPVGIALVSFDIYAITQGCAETLPYRYVIGIDLCVLSAIFLFETIYHYFKPIPGVIEAALESQEEEMKEIEKEASKDESKGESE